MVGSPHFACFPLFLFPLPVAVVFSTTTVGPSSQPTCNREEAASIREGLAISLLLPALLTEASLPPFSLEPEKWFASAATL
ncbi:hypothetical protein TWF281_008122 [Arthrobotrys megalospora]